MGFGNAICPQPDAVEDIDKLICGENLFQVQKLIIGRRTKARFADYVVPGTAAGWSPFVIAADETKVQITPFIEGLTVPAGAPITEGGDDNSTLNGTAVTVGAAQIRSDTGMIRSLPAAILKQLKAYNQREDLEVFLVNQFGIIWGQSPDEVAFEGIPITSFFVGDPGNQGLNTNDKAPVSFNLKYGWRDNLKGVIPTDFDALLDMNDLGA